MSMMDLETSITSNNSAALTEEYHEYMRESRPIYRDPRPSWDRHGLSLLIQETVNELGRMVADGHEGAERIYYSLPYNFVTSIGWGYPWEARIYDDVEKMVSLAARASGWLIAAADVPEVVRFIERTQSPRGMNSPATTVDLWAVIRKFASPGAFGRWLSKVRARANGILRPFGVRVSNRALAEVAQASRPGQEFDPCRKRTARVGKTARRAAKLTLCQLTGLTIATPWPVFRGFSKWFQVRNTPEAIVAAHLCQPLIESAGQWAVRVESLGRFETLGEALAHCQAHLIPDPSGQTDGYVDDSEPEQIIHGIRVRTIYYPHPKERFCPPYTMAEAIVTHPDGRTFHTCALGRYAVRAAIASWRTQENWDRRQEASRRKQERLIDSLLPGDRSILIWREDVRKTGACDAGVSFFASQHGWGNRAFVPASWLMPHKDNPYVRRALLAVAMEMEMERENEK